MANSPASGDSLRSIARFMSRAASRLSLRRGDLPILIFFHGYALAHTIRPLVLARALRERGYPVVLAGRGPHVVRIRQEGFDVHDVETLPQCRMDQYVSRGDYCYYNTDWIDRCVRSERMLIQMIKPALVVHEMKPTAHLSARLEGVDDARITQAYNHPAYSHSLPLMEGFGTTAGPFDEFLAAHAAEVRKQHSFYMLADVPELHPARRELAGYSYVGPLLDRSAEPESLDVLDDGWDTDLPLVYLTCGSSGRRPDYLDELVEAFRDKPYRVLITTANRWSPEQNRSPKRSSAMGMPANVRMVPFLNGEWVLRRAQVLVGIVGIGAIYQALSQGRPIIGAPEHLDQEYHLNRVQDLGLGIKLDRRDFDAPHILAAIDAVLANPEDYTTRCAPFAETLAEYPDGSQGVDLLDAHFIQRERQYHTSTAYLVPGDEFIRYLDASTPPSLDAGKIRSMLLRGARRGMPHRWVGKSLYFDRYDSWNWLNDNEPEFFEADYKACERRRQRFLQLRDGQVRARESWQRLQVSYHVRLHPRAADGTVMLHPGERLKLFLPYPIQRPGHQSEVQLKKMRPAELSTELLPDMGFVYGAEIVVPDNDAPIEVGYTCSLSIKAQSMDSAAPDTTLSAGERARCLQLDGRIVTMPEAIALRAELKLAELPDDEARARAIYRHLATSKRFKKTRDAASTPRFATSTVLRDNGGHCSSLARTFTSLCRAEGIPTREVTGALLGYPVSDNIFEARSYGETMFGHTWAEIWLEQRGWVPVEFHGIVIGAGALTRKNVSERRLRREIESVTEPWLDFYFGHLDNHRILGSPSAKTTPMVMGAVADPAPGKRPWEARNDLRFDCLLRAECV